MGAKASKGAFTINKEPLLTVDEVRSFVKMRYPYKLQPLVPLTVPILRRRLRKNQQITGVDVAETWVEDWAPVFEGTASDRFIELIVRDMNVTSIGDLCNYAKDYDKVRARAGEPMSFSGDASKIENGKTQTIPRWLKTDDPPPIYALRSGKVEVVNGCALRGNGMVFLDEYTICDNAKIASNCLNTLVFTKKPFPKTSLARSLKSKCAGLPASVTSRTRRRNLPL